MYKIWLSKPHMSGYENAYVVDALTNNWVSPYGNNITEFENALIEYYGTDGIALTTTGTAAIHLSLILKGISVNDEVIVPTLNFAGCVNPILYQKAKPIFIDSDAENWNINVDLVREIVKEKKAKNSKLKAIIGVDLFGIPCYIDKLREIADEYGLYLIQDAADAIGTKYKGKLAGTTGDLGIVSFNGNKIITTSGGGALICKTREEADKARYYSNQARNNTLNYEHAEVGYNYMMSNILAGIGLGQMSVLSDRLGSRKKIYDRYRTELECSELQFHTDTADQQPNNWLSTLIVNTGESSNATRTKLTSALSESGIESRPFWKPMHLQQAYSSFEYYGSKVAENLFNIGLCLPSSSSLTVDEQTEVIQIIKHSL
ncbi:MAG: aminotransferase class I/II-fold pyridoxal phosphate-dependent enzyme [Bacteroidota bacterium]|nr:aminotransferase class I/II-fold pyridoxal phosphate-dependent enzyme [Bacteroidota bacterium]